jgi:hypothetical protein
MNANHITISDVHLRLLAWMDEHDGIPHDVMATMLGIKSTTLTTLLDDLQRVGLLRLASSEQPQR